MIFLNDQLYNKLVNICESYSLEVEVEIAKDKVILKNKFCYLDKTYACNSDCVKFDMVLVDDITIYCDKEELLVIASEESEFWAPCVKAYQDKKNALQK